MSAITVTHTLPAELVAISSEALETRDLLLDRAVAIQKDGAITTETYQEAADTYKAMGSYAKEIETQREKIKAPVLELGRQIDAAAREGLMAVEDQRKKLGTLINTYEAAERARVAEEQRKAREAALAAERAERLRQEEALRLKAELEAPPGEEPKPVDVEEIRVRPVVAAFVPTFKGVTKATPKQRVNIIDQSLIPFQVNGIRLWKEPDLKAIETLLKAGVKIPGAEMTTETTIGAKGGA